jgi:hypothetical protein
MPSEPGFGVNGVDQSPPKLGGVPSRSEGGAVCSKTRSDLMDFRAALLINSVRFAEIHKEPLRGILNRPPQPSLREGIPA